MFLQELYLFFCGVFQNLRTSDKECDLRIIFLVTKQMNTLFLCLCRVTVKGWSLAHWDTVYGIPDICLVCVCLVVS